MEDRRIRATWIVAALACSLSAAGAAAAPAAAAPAPRVHQQARAQIPRPRLNFTGTERYTTADGEWRRYRLTVTNRAAFPAALFAPSPDLPPCGLNTNSARSWLDIYDGDDKRLYGFCTLDSPPGLEKLWFNLRSNTAPPAFVYVELVDRRTGERYRSNKVAIPRLPLVAPGERWRRAVRARRRQRHQSDDEVTAGWRVPCVCWR